MSRGAVLLDVDGTLLDSNAAHASAWVDALAEGGQHVPPARIRPLIGMGADKLLPDLTGLAADSPAGQEIARRRQEIFLSRYLRYVDPFPDARLLIERLRGDDLAVAVASSAGADEIRALLDRAGVLDLFDEAASKDDDAARSKPDADIIRAALARAGADARQAVMIGDTPYDIKAARRSGVRAIALRCGGHWSEQDLVGAIAIYNDPTDLLEHYNDSPIGLMLHSHA